MAEADEGRQRSGFVLPKGASVQVVKRLAVVTAEFSAAETLADVVTAAVTHGSSAIGAAVTTLMLVRGQQMEMVAATGLQPGVHEQWGTFGLDDDNPASETARTGRPILLRDSVEVAARYPVLRETVRPGRSLVSLPFGGGAPARGVLGLTFEHNYLPGDNELDVLLTFAGGCGQALGRIESAELAHQRTVELAFLAEASAELARSLDYRATLNNVAQLAVPWLADWCSVDIVTDGVPSTVAVAHADPAKTAWAWELREKFPYDPDAVTGSPNVIRTGVSELYPRITEEMLSVNDRGEDYARLMRDLNLRSALVVPLVARGRTFGAITLIRTDQRKPYEHGDLALAEDLGRRAGTAVDNARLYESSQNVALQLQNAVLPAALDDMPGWEVATHYAPGGDVGVGGDFYDAVELPDGRLVVVIGDVMGHGLAAAAAMAQVRSALRAYLTFDPEPEVVVGKLDNMYRLLGASQLITLVYGVVDRSRHTLTFVNAGHYPPLVLNSSEPARFARTDPRLPLGAGSDDRTPAMIDFADDDTLLLYTDGLIERRGEILDVGFARLSDAASALLMAPLGDGLSRLVQTVGSYADDDVTAFAMRARQ